MYGDGRKPALRTNYIVRHFTEPLPASAVCAPRDCIAQVWKHHGSETGFVVTESAINLNVLSRSEAAVIMGDLPQRAQTAFQYLDWAESGSETRVRYFFQRKGVKVRAQVKVRGVGRIDMLVGDCLVVECDSKRYHSSQASYEEDRRRDLALQDLGLAVTRLSFHQIWDNWEETQESLIGKIRGNEHRASRYQKILLASALGFCE